MKKTLEKSICILLAVVCLLSLVACGESVPKEGLWKNATYLKDTELGSGKNTAVVEVVAGEQSVTFTVKTDETSVGAALLEHKLIEGEDGPYGLYVTKANGITADYTEDESYWAFYVGDKYATSGIDDTEITKGVTYKLEYTK